MGEFGENVIADLSIGFVAWVAGNTLRPFGIILLPWSPGNCFCQCVHVLLTHCIAPTRRAFKTSLGARITVTTKVVRDVLNEMIDGDCSLSSGKDAVYILWLGCPERVVGLRPEQRTGLTTHTTPSPGDDMKQGGARDIILLF